MRLSSILAPTSRNNPAKVKDQRLIRLVRAGYAVYDNSAGKILLTPLGIRILERVSGKIKAAFEEKGSQQISGCQSEDAPFEVMVRVLKIKDQLPVTLMEEKNRKIDLTGFAPDEDILSMKMEDHIQACREVLFSGGIKVFSISEITPEGKKYALIVDGDKKALGFRDGIICPNCGWRGLLSSPIEDNAVADKEQMEKLEETHTPGATTIAELCRQLDLPSSRTLKTMFYKVDDGAGQLVAALMRGDRNISLEKLSFYLGGVKLRRASEDELKEAVGEVAGFCGPIGLPENIKVVADQSIEDEVNLAVGANRPDYHYTGACWGRDFKAHIVCDITSIEKELPCPSCEGDMGKGYFTEVGAFRVFNLRDEDHPSLKYVDDDRRKCRPMIWKGSLDLEQILLTILGNSSEDLGIWSNFDIALVSTVSSQDNVFAEVENLYESLISGGFRVLFDDREKKIKAKIEDSVEMGIPVRIMAGTDDKGGLKMEVCTSGSEGTLVTMDELEEQLLELK